MTRAVLGGLLLSAVLGASALAQEAAGPALYPEPEPGDAAGAATLPAPAQPPAPTQATFVSESSRSWTVVVDGRPVCGTPCSGPLYPHQFVSLHSREPRPVVLDVGRLPPGEFTVVGRHLQDGQYAGGIVAVTLGGMALATGITLVAVGLAKDKGGMTTAGLISGGAGLLAIPGGIYLMVVALPIARVERAPGPGLALTGRF